MNLGKYYERIERSESRMERSEMKEINYTCAHMDFNKSYGCAKCDEDRKQAMKYMDKDMRDKMMDTNSAAAKAMRKG